ncbi:hypothetical protein ACMZ4X_04853 [Achromobacter marplatensis]
MPAKVAGVLGGAAATARRDQANCRADVARPRAACGDRCAALQGRVGLAGAAPVPGVVRAAEPADDSTVRPPAAPRLHRDAKAAARNGDGVQRDAGPVSIAADAIAAIRPVGVPPQAAAASRRVKIYAAAAGGDRAGCQGVVDDPPASAVAAPVIGVRVPAVAAPAAADIDEDAGLAGRGRVDALITVLVDQVRRRPLAVVAVVRVITARAASPVRAPVDIRQRFRLRIGRPAEHVKRRDAGLQQDGKPGEAQAVAARVRESLRGHGWRRVDGG